VPLLDFHASQPLSLGVKLEVQLLSPDSLDLVQVAQRFQRP
jgi:hypothetical protein